MVRKSMELRANAHSSEAETKKQDDDIDLVQLANDGLTQYLQEQLRMGEVREQKVLEASATTQR